MRAVRQLLRRRSRHGVWYLLVCVLCEACARGHDRGSAGIRPTLLDAIGNSFARYVRGEGLRTLVSALVLAALLLPSPADAQRAGRVVRVGILSGMVWAKASTSTGYNSFFRRLSELEWGDGRNLVLERRYAEGRLDRLPALAQELVRSKVDVIVAFGLSPTGAARGATRTIRS